MDHNMEPTMKRERQFLMTWIYSKIYDHKIKLVSTGRPPNLDILVLEWLILRF